MSNLIETDAKPHFPKNVFASNDTTNEIHNFITKTITERFVEDSYDYHDESEYNRKGNDPGLVLIFNHEKFDDRREIQLRKGTAKDVEAIIMTLQRLKFNIEEKYIFNNFTTKAIEQKIDEICKDDADLKERNALICFVLTHGTTDNSLSTYDGEIKAEYIYEKFGNCVHLKDKPKLFVFQACKSGKSKEIKSVDKKLVSTRTITTRIPEDVLLFYSTLEDQVSYRNIIDGTWLIQELCRNFASYGRLEDVLKLVIRTTKCVTYYHYQPNDDEVFDKQQPIFISTLNKRFFLTLSKERMYLLKIANENKLIKQQLLDLQKEINNLQIM